MSGAQVLHILKVVIAFQIGALRYYMYFQYCNFWGSALPVGFFLSSLLASFWCWLIFVIPSPDDF